MKHISEVLGEPISDIAIQIIQEAYAQDDNDRFNGVLYLEKLRSTDIVDKRIPEDLQIQLNLGHAIVLFKEEFPYHNGYFFWRIVHK